MKHYCKPFTFMLFTEERILTGLKGGNPGGGIENGAIIGGKPIGGGSGIFGGMPGTGGIATAGGMGGGNPPSIGGGSKGPVLIRPGELVPEPGVSLNSSLI